MDTRDLNELIIECAHNDIQIEFNSSGMIISKLLKGKICKIKFAQEALDEDRFVLSADLVIKMALEEMEKDKRRRSCGND